MSQATEFDLPLIGWKERIDLPEWGFGSVLAKSDTGAQTSAIDAVNIDYLPRRRVRFDAVIRRGSHEKRKTLEADVVRSAEIRSSNGRVTKRCVVATKVVIGEYEFVAEFSLVSRPKMKCRILLGRSALAGRFLVDCDSEYRLTEKRQPTVD